MRILESLQAIGLTESEAKVYLALLETGKETAGVIAAKSATTSSKIYEVLDKLVAKGLASHFKENGIKRFSASSPDILQDYLAEKEYQIAEEKKRLQTIMPELHRKATQARPPSEANIYRGMKGMKIAFYDALQNIKRGDEVLVMNTPRRTPPVDRFFLTYSHALHKKGIHVKSILSSETAGPVQPASPLKMEIRYTREPTAAAINIFGDRVIIFPREAASPLLFVIDDKDVAQSFRAEFKNAWQKTTKKK